MPPLSSAQRAMRVGPDGFLGASEIAAVVGVSRWHRPIDIWLEKTGRAEPEPENPRASIGLRAESVMFDWWIEDTRTDPSFCRVGESTRHPTVSCAGCTPDTVVTIDGRITKLVQYKCVGARMAHFWSEDGVPGDVECQCQYEMEVTGAESADVVAWLGGTDFRIIGLERDREFGAMLLKGAQDFWQCVRDDVPPPIDGSESWRKYLARRYPVVEREELDPATDEVDRWANESLRSRERIEELGKDQEAADNHLRALIGERAGFIGGDYRVTWHADKNGKRTLRVKRRKNPND
jgi:putative phage-type endonuclease